MTRPAFRRLSPRTAPPYADHALCQVIDAVLELRPDLVVAGFGGHRARSLGWGLLNRIVRRGTPLVVIP